MMYIIAKIILFILFTIIIGVPLYLIVRAFFDEDFRKEGLDFARELKQAKNHRSGGSSYFNEKDYDMYLKTGNRDYLCKRH